MTFGIVRFFLLGSYFSDEAPDYLHSQKKIDALKTLLQRIYTKQETISEILSQMDARQIDEEVSKDFNPSAPTKNAEKCTLRFEDHNTNSYKRRFKLGIIFTIFN